MGDMTKKSKLLIAALPLLLAGLLLTTRVQSKEAKRTQFIVCIDPGHPSETSDGATANGLSENTLNWNVAVKLANKLNKAGIPFV